MPVRSHVREALAQLRRWSPIAGGVVALASLVQLLVFGFVHFTDVRYEQLSNGPEIVQTSGPGFDEPTVQFQSQWELAQRRLAGEYQPPINVNKVESSFAVVLRRANQTAVFLGMIGVVSLVTITMLGCVIAGGGAVPGIEKILGAAGGAMLLGVATVPWNEAFPSVPIAGVFTGYKQMTIASDGSQGAMTVSLIAMHAVVPLVVLVGAVFIAMRFHDGVDEGYIVRDAAEAEDLLDQDIEYIAKHGVGSTRASSLHLSRTLGQTRGDVVAPASTPAVGAVSPAPAPRPVQHEPPVRRPL